MGRRTEQVATVPALGKPTFDISDTEMGEWVWAFMASAGVKPLPLSSATEIVEHLAGID